MILARVIGNVWSTRKEESLRGLKFLVVQPIGLEYDNRGMLSEIKDYANTIIAADRIGAGETEIVMVATGSSARQSLEDTSIPVDAIVIGIIDRETFDKVSR